MRFIFSWLFLFYIGNVLAKEVPKDLDGIISIKELPTSFKEKYTDEVFVYEYNFDPNKRSLWEEFKHWLSKKFKEWFGIIDENKAGNFVDKFIKFLYYLVFAIVLYLIFKAFVKKDGNWVFGRNSNAININSSLLKEELLDTNYKELIKKALQKNDYRLAIRYNYLLTLKALTTKEIIDWDNDKTNYDYLKEIKDEYLKNQFKYISYIYDYCWYGEFNLTKNSFTKAQDKFNNLIKNING